MKSCHALALLGVLLGGVACSVDIPAREARQLVAQGALLLDVRTPSEFAERHVPGAVNIPVEQLKERLAEVGPRGREVVVYCHSGARAGVAAMMLRKAGYSRVHNLGAMARWSRDYDAWPVLQ